MTEEAPKPLRNFNRDDFLWKGSRVVKTSHPPVSITFRNGIWEDEVVWNDHNIWRE